GVSRPRRALRPRSRPRAGRPRRCAAQSWRRRPCAVPAQDGAGAGRRLRCLGTREAGPGGTAGHRGSTPPGGAERCSSADAVGTADRRDGSGRPVQPAHRAGPVRDTQDGRDAPDQRLPQARDQVASPAGRGTSGPRRLPGSRWRTRRDGL
ncbi:MAG: hypothetical protein AVDCRST_MAG24-599, partial [uncultured Nocardioidaceae bacterium]